MVASPLSPAELRPLLAAERRRKLISWSAAAVLTVLVGVTLVTVDQLDAKIVLASLLGLLAAMAAGLSVAAGRHFAAFVEVLEREAERVVWICPTRNIQAAQHESTTFDLTLDDGRRVSATVGPNAHAEVEAMLCRRCPAADCGYSPELEQRHAATRASGRAAARAPEPAPSEGALDPAEALAQAIRSDRRLGLYLGYPTAAIAALFAAMYVGVREPVVLVLTVVAIVGAGLLLRWGHRDPRAHRLMVALERDPGRLDSIELSYVSYGAEPTPELRVEYSGGGLDMFGLRPGTERAIIEWIAERRSG